MESSQLRQWISAALFAFAVAFWEAVLVVWVVNCGGRPIW